MNTLKIPIHVFTELKANYNDQEWWHDRAMHYLVRPFHQRVYPGYRDGIQIMDEDWDVLIVLDACRFDLFEEVFDIDRFDSYQTKTSLGSATTEWTARNFAGNEHGDTVYVSANPFTTTVAGNSFHNLIEVWDGAFDEGLKTVPPEAVADAAVVAGEEHPNKRMIVHFMQPHYPFIGSRKFGSMGFDPDAMVNDTIGDDLMTPWVAIKDGIANRDEVWKAYRQNLEIVMNSVYRVTDTVSGRTIITSDHGNMIGERGWPIPIPVYGHPVGLRYPQLVEVPWAVLEDRERRQVTNDGIQPVAVGDRGVINDRLRDLGYLQE